MTCEARVLFVAAFFLLWGALGFLSWAVMAVFRRGRGVLPALPMSVLGAWLGGLAVPLVAGARDERGLGLSLGVAFLCGALGTAAGLYLTEQIIEPTAAPRIRRPARPAAGGARRHPLDSDHEH
jgi:hypothetical protein